MNLTFVFVQPPPPFFESSLDCFYFCNMQNINTHTYMVHTPVVQVNIVQFHRYYSISTIKILNFFLLFLLFCLQFLIKFMSDYCNMIYSLRWEKHTRNSVFIHYFRKTIINCLIYKEKCFDLTLFALYSLFI